MSLFGLHWIDASIILLYIVAVLSIGKVLAHGVKGQGDFFLGGRSLGKWFQFFLSFGSMADPGQATTTSSSVYRQGAGGAWLALITLFLTPYYWFLNVWFRRVRLTTTAEMFEDRFGKRFLGSLYASTTLIIIVVSIAGGNVVALKTLQPLMTKAPAAYSVAEAQKVADFHEFIDLRQLRVAGTLPAARTERYDILKNYYDRGQLQPYVTYLHPLTFYLVSTGLVAVFVMLGGLKASAVVDAVQAILVILISVVLIPFGLAKLGGTDGLHRQVPEAMFNLFGGGAMSEYTWYSIGALLLVQFLGISSSTANMTVAGSAKNEFAARLGAVTGGFSKRFVTIAWAYCGLIAIALFGPGLSDPDQEFWGLLTKSLLPVGLVGVMIIGILGGKLAVLGAQSVVMAGLVVKNIYEPLFPGKSEKHYMLVARLSVPVALTLGVIIGLYLNSVIALLKFAIVFLVIWGVPITMIFLWRRLTETAVRVEVFTMLVLICVVPWTVPQIPALARSAALTRLTHERVVTALLATAADVAAGRAAAVGQEIPKTQRIEPVSVFFEEGVVRLNPDDLSSPRTGRGLFRAEVWLISLFGVDVARFSAAQLMTTRYLVDALLPVLILIVVSLWTQPADPKRVARFYVRMKTPVGKTLEEDAQAVEAAYANPTCYDDTKLFPRSNWEFTKWNRQDTLGFIACVALVGFILVFFKTVLVIGT